MAVLFQLPCRFLLLSIYPKTMKSSLKLSVLAPCTIIFVLAISANAQSPESLYTSLSSKSCKTLKVDKESESSVQSCPGIAGYKLLVEEGDLRQSITVVTAKGTKHELNY